MKNKKNTKKEILLKVQRNEISPEEAYQLMKEEKEEKEPIQGKRIFFYENVWSRKKMEKEVLHQENETIMICGDSRWKQLFENCFAKLVYVSYGSTFSAESNRNYHINPTEKSDWLALFDAVKADNMKIDRLVYIWNGQENQLEELWNKPDEAYKMALEGTDTVYELFYAIKDTDFCKKCYVIYPAANFESNPYASCMRGFSKSIHQVMPQVSVQVIGTDCLENSVGILKQEFQSGMEEQDIFYIGQERYIRMGKRTALEQKKNNVFHKDGVYLIIGGTGALGKILATHLVCDLQAKVVLAGRREKNEEMKEFIQSLNGSCSYVQADITKVEEILACVEKTEMDIGKINGILHVAGVSDEIDIFSKDLDAFHRILEPKVKGLLVVNEAVRNLNLEVFAVFSSISAIIGDFGQCDYAIGNCFMDSFMKYREQLCKKGLCNGKSVIMNWPMWKDGGMHSKNNPEGEKLYLKSSGLFYLENQEGVQAFDEIASSGVSQVIVMCGEEEKTDRIVLGKTDDKGDKKKIQKTQQKKVTDDTGSQYSLEKMQQAVARIAADLIDLPAERFDVTENFGEYGYDSITLKELSDKIGEFFQIELPQTVFFGYSNVKDLSIYLLEEFGGQLKNTSIGNEQSECIEKLTNQFSVETEEMKEQHLEDISQIPREEANNRYDAPGYKSAVAIIGASGIFPGSENLQKLWKNIEDGTDLIVEVPRERWDSSKYYNTEDGSGNHIKTKWGGFISDVDKFDASFFHISPLEAELMDPQQRLYLQEVWKTIETAGYKPSSMSGEQIGVFTGVQFQDYQQLIMDEMSEVHPLVGTGNSHAMISNRVSYFFNLKGPSESIDTACSGSLVAVHRALDSIRNGESKMAIAGGVSLMLSPANFLGAGKMGILSPDGRCKTFDKSANGYVKGEGVAAILLKPLKQAVQDKDCIWAIVRNSTEMHGGRANSLTAPNSNSQADLITKAYQDVDIPPETISYIEAHGTGTALGDPVEIDGLKKAFEQMYALNHKKMDKKNYCGVGSVKSNMGHLEPASGMAGIMKVVLSFQNKKLPKTLHIKEVNPLIEIKDSPFYFVTETKKWKHFISTNGTKIPYRAGISSFGFGGSYAHVVLEEHLPEEQMVRYAFSDVMLALSARTPERLLEYVQKMKGFLEQKPETDLYNMSYTLLTGREEMKEKVVFTGSNAATLVKQMKEFLSEGGVQRVFGRENTTIIKIAKKWASGKSEELEKLPYWNNSKKMILPTYPFAKAAYWVHGDKEKKQSSCTDAVHPLVDSNVSTLREQLYKKVFWGNEYYLKAHSGMFPAAMYLEMPRVCGELSLPGQQVIRIENASVLSPVVLSGNMKNEVFVKLIPDRESVFYQIFTYGLFNKRLVHSEGKVCFRVREEAGQQQKISIQEVLTRVEGGEKQAQEYYDMLENRGQKTGNLLRGMKEFFWNDQEAAAVLKENSALCKETEDCLLKPAIFDGGIHAMLAWIQKKDKDENMVYLPKLFGKVTLYKTDSPVVCSYIQKREKMYVIYYLNEEGEVVWKADGIVVAGIQQKKIKPEKKKSTPENLETSIVSSFTKEIVCCIESVLRMPAGSVEEDSELALFGLDSLTYTQLADEMNQKFALDITPAVFFGNSAPKDIAVSVYREHEEEMVLYYHKLLESSKENEEENNEEENNDRKEEKIDDRREGRFIFNENSIIEKEPVAIIGISGKFPQSDNLEEYWKNLEKQKDMVTEIPKERWDWKDFYGNADVDGMKTPYIWGGFMKNIDGFDPAFFHISPMEAEMMDPQARLMLEIVWKTIEDAGYRPSAISGTATGLYIGVTNEDYKDILIRNNRLAIMTPSLIANRISFLLNLRGPSEPVDTACSSALVALHKAVEEIQTGRCEMAIAGGVNVIASPSLYISQGAYGMLSKEGKCKTFDENADGYVRGEGVGAVLLKPLSKAVEDKDNIYGVIKGSSINHGGHGSSLTAPNSAAQAEIIIDAVKRSGIRPETIQYIEAHGTGTSLGDPVEIEGLKKAYKVLLQGQTVKEKSIGIGAVKTNIGHLESASGMASLIKVLLCIKYKKMIPLIHYIRQNPYIQLSDSPFYIITEEKEWKALQDENGMPVPRRAAISAFGMGGVNAHVVLEEYQKPEIQEKDSCQNLYVFTAKTKESLNGILENTYEFLTDYSDTGNIPGKVLDSRNIFGECIHDLCARLLKVKEEELEYGDSLYDYGFGFIEREKLLEKLEIMFGFQLRKNELSVCDTVNGFAETIYHVKKEKIDSYYQASQPETDVSVSYRKTLDMDSLAYTLQTGRENFTVKVAILAMGREELLQKMECFIKQKDAAGVFYSEEPVKNNGIAGLLRTKEGKGLVCSLMKKRDLQQIANLWIQNIEIPWEMLYKEIPYKMSLPSYVFSDRSFWIEDHAFKNFKKSPDKISAGFIKEGEHTELSDEEVMDVLSSLENGTIDGKLTMALLDGKDYL